MFEEIADSIATNKPANNEQSELPEKMALTISFVTCHHNDRFCVDIANGITRCAQENNGAYTMIKSGASSEAFLHKHMTGKVARPKHILLPCELMVRESSPGEKKTLCRSTKAAGV
jgi:hypothetical protein